MKFAILMLAEFAEVFVVCFLFAYFFLGGWDFFGLALPPVAVLGAKVSLGVVLIMVARWTLPRMRVDRLMELGWKFLIPAAFASILIVGVVEKLLSKGGA
jgi:NADH-quinone oxidoreductase subunit H